jgi:hypothetical protein
MPKTENIINHLPEIYGVSEKDTLLFRVIDAFGKKLKELEDNLAEIMRAHWVDHAATMDTLARLGELYDIRPRGGQVTDEEHSYEANEDTYVLKRAVVRKVEWVKGILEQTEHEFEKEDYTLINGKLKWVKGKDRPDDKTKFYVDYYWLEELGAYRRRLKETVKTYLSGVGTVQNIKDIVIATLNIHDPRLELIEFPPRLVVSKEQKVGLGSEWKEETRGFLTGKVESKPTLQITGIKERTVNPVITNATTGVQLQFEGIVPDGKVLTVTPEGTATLDGKDVSERIHSYRGSQFNKAYFNDYKFAAPSKGTPALPRGISKWRYSIKSATFADGDEYQFSYFNRALFGPLSKEVFDGPVAAIQLKWVEQQAATFIIRIPWRYEISEDVIADVQDVPARHELKAAVDRVKAAGVRAIIDYFEEQKVENNDQQEKLSFGLRSLISQTHTIEDRLSLTYSSILADGLEQKDEFAFLGVFDMNSFDNRALFN